MRKNGQLSELKGLCGGMSFNGLCSFGRLTKKMLRLITQTGKAIAISFVPQRLKGSEVLKNPLDSRDYVVHFGCKSPCLSVAISE